MAMTARTATPAMASMSLPGAPPNHSTAYTPTKMMMVVPKADCVNNRNNVGAAT